MRSIKPYEVWLPPLRSSQPRNARLHCLSITGDAQ